MSLMDPEDVDTLALALDRLRGGDEGAGAWSALPRLAELGAKGHRLTIDLGASARLGAAVVMVEPAPPGLAGLTPRQGQVAGLVAEGLTNKQIARRLGLSPATVKDHVHAILRRLGLARRSQIAARLPARP